MKTIDARGYSCPIPVVMLQNEVKASNPDELEILVDNKYAVENVTRFASGKGYSAKCSEIDEDYSVIIKKK